MTADQKDTSDLVGVLLTLRELLADLTVGPTAAVPPGLWRPLADALKELGDPARVVTIDGTGRLKVGESGYPDLKSPPAGAGPEASLEACVRILVTGVSDSSQSDGSLLKGLDQHGLVGAQLSAKKALIDHGYAEYVAGGRLPEIPKNDDGWLRRQARRLQRALGPCSTVLDSLSRIPPLGALGLVAEAVSAADHALEFGLG